MFFESKLKTTINLNEDGTRGSFIQKIGSRHQFYQILHRIIRYRTIFQNQMKMVLGVVLHKKSIPIISLIKFYTEYQISDDF